MLQRGFKEQQITITGSTSLDKRDIDRMIRDAETHAAEDRARREEIDQCNHADSIAYQVERLLRELGDRVPLHDKARADPQEKGGPRMSDEHISMVPGNRRGGLLTLEDVAARCRLHPHLVERFVALGLIEPVPGAPELFPPEATLRLQRILRLRRDLGINYRGLALVIELLEHIDILEARIQMYEAHPQETKRHSVITRQREIIYGPE